MSLSWSMTLVRETGRITDKPSWPMTLVRKTGRNTDKLADYG